MKVFIEYGDDGRIKGIDIPTTALEGEFAVDEEAVSVAVIDLPEVTAETPKHQLSAIAHEIMSNYKIDKRTKELVKHAKK